MKDPGKSGKGKAKVADVEVKREIINGQIRPVHSRAL